MDKGSSPPEEHRSLRGTLLQFGKSTSMRGVRRALIAESIAIRLLWTLGIVFGLSVALYLLTKILEGFLSHKTVTKMTDESGVMFPDLTLCNLNPLAVGSLHSMTIEDYLDRVEPFYDSYHEDPKKFFETLNINEQPGIHDTLEELFSTEGYLENLGATDLSNLTKQNALILSIKWYDWEWKLLHEDTNFFNASHIKIMFTPDYFMCSTIRVPERLSVLNIRGVSMILFLNNVEGSEVEQLPMFQARIDKSLATGVRLIVHPPGTLPDIKHGVNIAPGLETAIELYQIRKIMLPIRGACNDTVNEDDLVNPMTKTLELSGYNYSQFACTNLCFQLHIMNTCNCVSTRAIFTNKLIQYSNRSFCGKLGTSKDQEDRHVIETRQQHHEMNTTRLDKQNIMATNITFEDIKDTFKRLNCSWSVHISSSMCDPQCPNPCDVHSYQLSLSSTPWPNTMYLENVCDLYIKPNLNVSCDVEQNVKNRMHIKEVVSKNFLQLNILFREPWYEKRTEVENTNVVTLLANVGGILNLWSGITFMLLFELCELIYNIILMWKKPERPQSNTQMSNNDQCPNCSSKTTGTSLQPTKTVVVHAGLAFCPAETYFSHNEGSNMGEIGAKGENGFLPGRNVNNRGEMAE